MNGFSKLNRNEMREIKGGVVPIYCNTQNACAVTFPDHVVHVGICTETQPNGCTCRIGTEDYNPKWYCDGVS